MRHHASLRGPVVAESDNMLRSFRRAGLGGAMRTVKFGRNDHNVAVEIFRHANHRSSRWLFLEPIGDHAKASVCSPGRRLRCPSFHHIVQMALQRAADGSLAISGARFDLNKSMRAAGATSESDSIRCPSFARRC